jgi:hypothetical protein
MSTCTKFYKKIFKFNQIIFIIQYRNFQYRVPRCPLPSTEMSSTEYRDVLIPSHGGDSKTFKGMTST